MFSFYKKTNSKIFHAFLFYRKKVTQFQNDAPFIHPLETENQRISIVLRV